MTQTFNTIRNLKENIWYCLSSVLIPIHIDSAPAQSLLGNYKIGLSSGSSPGPNSLCIRFLLGNSKSGKMYVIFHPC